MRTILLTALQARLVLSGHQPDDYPLTKRTCVVQPAPEGGDSAPAIIQAFADCGHNEDGAINSSTTNSGNRGKVVFTNETYTVRSVMNTTGLRDVDVELHGTLVWDTDIQYWLGHSLPVGYQNQSSAWLFGGEGLRLDGFGHGTLDGNGQVWVSTYMDCFCFVSVWISFWDIVIPQGRVLSNRKVSFSGAFLFFFFFFLTWVYIYIK